MNPLIRRRLALRDDGMTLIEIMIVIAILGMLAAIVGVGVLKALEGARQGTAQAQIKDLESGLVLYNRDCGKYPSTAQGLQALVVNPGTCPRWKGYLEKNQIPNDPWGNPYEYFYPGTHGQEMEIISKGKDGELNTADDIVSWSVDAGGQAPAQGMQGGGAGGGG